MTTNIIRITKHKDISDNVLIKVTLKKMLVANNLDELVFCLTLAEALELRGELTEKLK